MTAARLSLVLSLCLTLATTACDGTLDAGMNLPHGQLPVDERNPIVLVNDSATDNWMTEYALLLADLSGPRVAGIIVCASNYWPDLNANVMGFTKLVNAAKSSGFEGVPDLTVSAGAPLSKPSDGEIDSTKPNESVGAERIIDLSHELSLPRRPLVIVVGTQLTDLADAYLVDRTVVDRVVVVAELGALKAPGALMTGPNGDLDPWADWIVAHRFRYVQVSVLYDQSVDVPTDKLGSLPKNAWGDFIAAKQPGISPLTNAADQTAVLSVGLPKFVTASEQVSPDPAAKFGSPPGQGSPLVPDDQGNARLVTKVDAPLAPSTFWRMLDASTQHH